jgi:hypothetical protein
MSKSIERKNLLKDFLKERILNNDIRETLSVNILNSSDLYLQIDNKISVLPNENFIKYAKTQV